MAEEEVPVSSAGEETANDDVAGFPNEAADPQEAVREHVPADILERYEVHSYRHAALILHKAHPSAHEEIVAALRSFKISTGIIEEAGKNESRIPKIFSAKLRPQGWHETTIRADLVVERLWKEPYVTPSGKTRNRKVSLESRKARFLDGHKVDFVKGRVAFDVEWNSKDQTFDRDLYAFSAFSQCGIVDVGVLLTRGALLNAVFDALGKNVAAKYGASTTWMGKLLYRLNAGRNGSCPVLAIGIRPECVEDWPRPIR